MVMTVALIIFCPVIVAVVGTTDGGGAACTLYASHHLTNVVVLPGKRASIPGVHCRLYLSPLPLGCNVVLFP